MHTQADLEEQIRKMGVCPEDILTVHTSLKAIGKIDNRDQSGAEVLLDALRNCTSKGILMIPAHTFMNILETPVFDIRNTMPCIGALPCVAVKLANQAYDAGDMTCVRSMQGSHSVVAFGNGAYDFVACDRKTKTRTSMEGCYGNLYKQNGKILLIGVGLCRNTYTHMVDEYFDYQCCGKVPTRTDWFHVIDYDGTEWEQERLYTIGPSSAVFDQYADAVKQSGAATYGKIGDADAILLDARKYFDVIMDIRKSEQ